jgi:hypothetical protein
MSYAGDMSVTDGKGGPFWSRGRGGGVGEAFGAVWVIGAPVGHARNPEGKGGCPILGRLGSTSPVWCTRRPGGSGHVILGLPGLLVGLRESGCAVWRRRAPVLHARRAGVSGRVVSSLVEIWRACGP